jgi:cytochrome c
MNRREKFKFNALPIISLLPVLLSYQANASQDNSEIEALIKKGNCWGCHNLDELRIGPTYKMIASKYAETTDDKIEVLVQKVRYGGAGNWGVVPMIPNSKLSEQEIKAIVHWILKQ